MDHSKHQNPPRGIRNNNPLNLRVGNNWKGEVSQPTDHTFEQFTEMKWGVRAAFIVLRNYIVRHKLNTIRKIITRWAPSNENNTQRYIDIVSQLSGINPTEAIRYEDKTTMVSLVDAMIRVECGQPVERRIIIKAYDLA